MDSIVHFLTTIIVGAAVVPACVWYTKNFIDSNIRKEVENYKARLKDESTREIEFIKSQIEKESPEPNQSSDWLHQKRVNAIDTLYASFAELCASVNTVLHVIGPRNPIAIRKYTQIAFDKTQQVYTTFLRHKIFLESDTSQVIESSLKSFLTPAARYYLFQSVYNDQELRGMKDISEEVWQELDDNLMAILDRLEKELKSLIHVSREFR